MMSSLCNVCVSLVTCDLVQVGGEGGGGEGIEKATGTVRVEVDPKYYRPTEVVSIQVNLKSWKFKIKGACIIGMVYIKRKGGKIGMG